LLPVIPPVKAVRETSCNIAVPAHSFYSDSRLNQGVHPLGARLVSEHAQLTLMFIYAPARYVEVFLLNLNTDKPPAEISARGTCSP
jgi:hypothetical protein